MNDERECPACGEVFSWIDGKDKRKYANHLESHLGEIDHTGRKPENWKDDLPNDTVEYLEGLGDGNE